MLKFLTLLNSPLRAADAEGAASASAGTPVAPPPSPSPTPPGEGAAAGEDKSLLGAIPDEDKPKDPPKEGDKPKEDKPAEGAFKFEDLKLPEGFKFADEAQGKTFSDLATKYGLSQQAAQDLFDFGANAIKAQTEGATKLFSETAEKWVGQIKADPEIGDPQEGLKPGVKASIGKVLDQYGSKDLRAAFDMTGAGNNPEVVKFLYNVSKALTEPGSHIQGGVPGAKSSQRPSLADAMYPQLAAEAAKGT